MRKVIQQAFLAELRLELKPLLARRANWSLSSEFQSIVMLSFGTGARYLCSLELEDNGRLWWRNGISTSPRYPLGTLDEPNLFQHAGERILRDIHHDAVPFVGPATKTELPVFELILWKANQLATRLLSPESRRWESELIRHVNHKLRGTKKTCIRSIRWRLFLATLQCFYDGKSAEEFKDECAEICKAIFPKVSGWRATANRYEQLLDPPDEEAGRPRFDNFTWYRTKADLETLMMIDDLI